MRKALGLAAVLALLIATADVQAQEKPRMGGVLKVASIGEPPTLDLQATTTSLTYQIMWHVYEPLFTHDRGWTPVPHLAESHAISDRGLRHVITLRKGVKFHNGKEMTAADAVASLKRWGQVATLGRVLWPNVVSIEAKDPYTVVLSLKQPSGSLIYGLSEASAVIYTREVAETAGANQVNEVIGTGPYRFVEHKAARHVKLARFNDYARQAVAGSRPRHESTVPAHRGGRRAQLRHRGGRSVSLRAVSLLLRIRGDVRGSLERSILQA